MSWVLRMRRVRRILVVLLLLIEEDGLLAKSMLLVMESVIRPWRCNIGIMQARVICLLRLLQHLTSLVLLNLCLLGRTRRHRNPDSSTRLWRLLTRTIDTWSLSTLNRASWSSCLFNLTYIIVWLLFLCWLFFCNTFWHSKSPVLVLFGLCYQWGSSLQFHLLSLWFRTSWSTCSFEFRTRCISEDFRDFSIA